MKIAISGMVASGKSTLTKKLHTEYFKNSFMLKEYEEDDEVFEKLLKWKLEKKPNVVLPFEVYIMDNHIEKMKKLYKEYLAKDNYYIFSDRFSIEHQIFAITAFEKEPHKHKTYLDVVNSIIVPEVLPDYIFYLDVTYETFEKRFLKRQYKSEMDTYHKNKEAFKKLHTIYKENFVNLCKEFNLKYHIVDVNNLDENEVAQKVASLIQNLK
ncbi:deoxynucleoside kinase [Mycoplasmopsis synoviae]|uniref:Deoxynucleoside kinase domain-containing protein n=2 Tax=Mycoplasmopsis synoviae TaxID=2109 RepID=Q4A6R0_MYCS5|nr:deoxynucleoside kinase [Mycoplasmopsis synoviae]AAZ43561.1 conserved hypothetical protein [Mycoplasmopsis synoviae 53]AWL83976.1 hypothetical protein MSH_00775 [Mycoplasmopsis synoviae]QLE13705.1 hypothetical protein DEH79_00770 [Mycoplasmopsis synoviae]UBX97759.1 deoxynucleoside kinase [Mycoplasmopsis synoviae]UBX97833.1 deoxynucleoside kinase [Mycoplasmopsis synoviae]